MKAKIVQQANTDFPQSIGNPARNALDHAGYTKLRQLTGLTEADLLKLHGVGPKAVGILRETLKAMGMSFAPPAKSKGKNKGGPA
jgi:DNA-directed RNA polymerase alpha subunit